MTVQTGEMSAGRAIWRIFLTQWKRTSPWLSRDCAFFGRYLNTFYWFLQLCIRRLGTVCADLCGSEDIVCLPGQTCPTVLCGRMAHSMLLLHRRSYSRCTARLCQRIAVLCVSCIYQVNYVRLPLTPSHPKTTHTSQCNTFPFSFFFAPVSVWETISARPQLSRPPQSSFMAVMTTTGNCGLVPKSFGMKNLPIPSMLTSTASLLSGH
jgi:hypothetical protein